jgi:hypothetical protein
MPAIVARNGLGQRHMANGLHPNLPYFAMIQIDSQCHVMLDGCLETQDAKMQSAEEEHFEATTGFRFARSDVVMRSQWSET